MPRKYWLLKFEKQKLKSHQVYFGRRCRNKSKPQRIHAMHRKDKADRISNSRHLLKSTLRLVKIEGTPQVCESPSNP
ncbi:hypothetical protein CDL12_03153 [Handroanthus impetiginosus]|uniref:Uncharacterized protein n=1 Tax=Handroanthus impetiginosus TaxID=429701 RepID=A0A2G9I3E0_9LAMI|nr:hypothetical protein CDL12_03153 [Handroanthus impetiginosus]